MKKTTASFAKYASLLAAALLPCSAFASLPLDYTFDNFDNWTMQFNAGPSGGGFTNTAGAVDGKLRVSSSHIDYNGGVSNNARLSARATNTGTDLDFYTQGISIAFNDVSVAFTSESGRPAAWGANRRVAFGINSRNDRFFFSSSTVGTTSIYFIQDDNGALALAYNRNIADDPNPPADASRPNIIQSFAEAYSNHYDSIVLTLDGSTWGVSISFMEDGTLRTFNYSGTNPTPSTLWQGNGDAFYLAVGAEALNGFGAESTTISIGSINVTAIPEPSSFAVIGALATIGTVLVVRRRQRCR